MKNVGSLFAIFWLGACAIHSTRVSCSLPALQKKELDKIVQEEVKKRGGDPTVTERSRVKVKRDGCDYIYYLVYRPKRPGGYLFVRINESGQIVDWTPGL